MPIILDQAIHKTLLEATYQEVARFLLTECYLQVDETTYRLLEIEYYPLDDPYSHRHQDQYTPGRWYFHRKGGTYKGVDITCCGGSFLLRALENIETCNVIEGPSLLVDCLLDGTSHQEVKDLITAYRYPAQRNTNLHLINIPRDQQKLEADLSTGIIRSRRIGLREDSNRYDHRQARLRFLQSPTVLKKGRKLLIDDLRKDGMTDTTILALIKCSSRSLY